MISWFKKRKEPKNIDKLIEELEDSVNPRKAENYDDLILRLNSKGLLKRAKEHKEKWKKCQSYI